MQQRVVLRTKKVVGGKVDSPLLNTVFFTDRNKIHDIDSVIQNLPQGSAVLVREYDLTREERKIFATKILTLCRSKNVKVIVGKDLALAKELKADGVHFSDRDRLPIQLRNRKFFPKNFILSFACHSLKSARAALLLNPDLLFISPIFPTTSHQNAKPLGFVGLSKILASLVILKTSPNPQLYALGGVNFFNFNSLRKLRVTGFGGIDCFNNFNNSK